ncbi:hypothetical protein M3G15_12305 [Paenibacillus sp. p3-SID1389]|uniref:hypothetical protein n=1 Tax=Paenibacillus TaxID=44249 RepID=UPI0021A3CD5C|nr:MULTISPECIES: hypothetical protein [Paenibacillus]MCT2195922.1 hypothetical protein [Paenibacillus sp. p3-SID1389]MEC2346330.1 hypothetical protein [Paenibacillus barengoltzii]
MVLNYDELSEQLKGLYFKLLDNSRKQLAYLDELEEDLANNLSSFLKLQQDWNRCTREINKLDEIIRDAELSNDLTDEEWRIKVLREIEANIEKIKAVLRMNFKNTGANLSSVHNQRKVLNAYYGLQRNDQVPLYLDEKK